MKECNAQETPKITRQGKTRNVRCKENLEDLDVLTGAPYRESIGS